MVQRPRYCRGKREERPAAQVTGCTSDTPDPRGKKEIASNGRFTTYIMTMASIV